MKRTVSFILVFLLGTICLQAQQGKFRRANKPVKDSYIVVLNDKTTASSDDKLNAAAARLRSRYGGEIKSIFGRALNGFAVRMSPGQARSLAQDPDVAYVEEDGYTTVNQSPQTSPPWGLDRIDQRSSSLDGNFYYYSNGSNVYAYVVDTGISAHSEFGSRAAVAVDVLNDGQNGNDCHGHGTAVAGIIGAATYGVAKNVNIRAVRVADCSGAATFSNIVSGLNWIINNRSNPAVVNISLGDGGASSSLDTAVNNTFNSGITVIAAAGNINDSACNHSPARVSNAITVAASDTSDARWSDSSGTSNYGGCVDVFAPGANITTTSNSGSTLTGSGTSFAAPHVAGVVALYLSAFPAAKPADATTAVINLATPNVVSNAGTGTPNRLLFTRFGNNSSTSVQSSVSGCYYTSSVSTGDGGFYAYFATGYGGGPTVYIEKNISGSWWTVASGTNQVLYADTAGTFRLRACVSAGGGFGWFVAVLQYPNP